MFLDIKPIAYSVGYLAGNKTYYFWVGFKVWTRAKSDADVVDDDDDGDDDDN